MRIAFLSLKVSIIIPTFNRAKKLESALVSVIGQTYENFEILVVDDGSTDNTKEVVDSFSDNRIIYFKKPNEKHPSIARNYALEYVKGDYVAFLDSDDSWKKDKLEKQVRFLEGSPGYVYCFTQASGIQNGDRTLVSGWFPIKSGKIFNSLLFRNFVVTSSVLVRSKDLLEEKGFPENLKIAEDLDLWLRLSKRGKAQFIGEDLVDYSLDGGISGDVPETLSCLEKVLRNNLEKFKVGFFIRLLTMLFFRLRKSSKSSS